MSKPFVAGVGAVLSADIAVPEHERALRFYSRVLSTGTNPLWREKDLMNNLGIPIMGLGKRTEEYAHLPLQWMPQARCQLVSPEPGVPNCCVEWKIVNTSTSSSSWSTT